MDATPCMVELHSIYSLGCGCCTSLSLVPNKKATWLNSKGGLTLLVSR